MNILCQLSKNKCYFILITILFSSCKDQNYLENNIQKSFKEYGYNERALIYRDKYNTEYKDTKIYFFMDGVDILKKLDENFFLMGIIQKKDDMIVNLYSFKTGKALTCHYNKNILKSKEIKYIKMGESKPFYIYYEILKRKYPNYMNWKLFPIPKDSLK